MINDDMGMIDRSITAFNFPVLLLCDPADAWPAIFFHLDEVFEAIEVHGNIGSFLTGGFLAHGESFVDVVDAADFKIVGAIGSHGEGDEGQEEDNCFHGRFVIIS